VNARVTLALAGLKLVVFASAAITAPTALQCGGLNVLGKVIFAVELETLCHVRLDQICGGDTALDGACFDGAKGHDGNLNAHYNKPSDLCFRGPIISNFDDF
jgi:hypothetical protein